ncbi:uncharacterized protein LOC128883275 [Hylaeus volcanicus]|uniref:uncharacterized protein LOC128883275 n=1 Tax=Hylaeus volcanicus TaxID=313075 RepID=UPI0023B82B66|nr:uncharacterized protein LOC128883275 [Hylaeus volcanicus]
MGIANLLIYLRPLTKDITLQKYAGSVVAVDAMCWMHRGAVATATELWMNTKPNPRFIVFFMKMVNLLLRHKIKPVIIFDGHKIPMKAAEHECRKNKRDAANAEVQTLLSKGVKPSDKRVRSKLVEAIKVTEEMIQSVKEALKNAHVEYIVAPYEADAQLAYLCRAGFVKTVITEDSDLLVYGCPRVIYKLTNTGECQEIDVSSLKTFRILNPISQQELTNNDSNANVLQTHEIKSSTDITLISSSDNVFRTVSSGSEKVNDAFLFETNLDNDAKNLVKELNCLDYPMFISMCVLSGCDYTTDVHVPGIGLKSAFSFISRYRTLPNVFNFFERDPKWKKKLIEAGSSSNIPSINGVPHHLRVPIQHMISQFVFQYHYVYNPLLKCVTHISTAEFPGPEVYTTVDLKNVEFFNYSANTVDFLGSTTREDGEPLAVHEIFDKKKDMVSLWKLQKSNTITKNLVPSSNKPQKSLRLSEKRKHKDLVYQDKKESEILETTQHETQVNSTNRLTKKQRNEQFNVDRFVLSDSSFSTEITKNDDQVYNFLNHLTNKSHDAMKKKHLNASSSLRSWGRNTPETLILNTSTSSPRRRDIIAEASLS